MQSKTPFALLLTLSLTACATPSMVKQGKSVATEADLHAITVTQAGVRLEVPVTGANGAVSAETIAQLNQFGANYRAVGHGPLMVSTPTGSSDADSAARVSQAVRMQLVDSGGQLRGDRRQHIRSERQADRSNRADIHALRSGSA